MGKEVVPTPLPVGQVVTVFMVQLCEGININVLFPFVAFMVEDFGYTGKELGYHVGGLAATFCLAQFVSSVPWGSLSDRIGRKPPVVMGVLGSAVGMVVLGISTSYSQAVAGRAISGLLTGNVGILKSFLTEITDDSNRGHGFSLMSLGWSLGTILGPLAGGVLAYPAVKYPGVFAQDGIFAEHAFLLPCLLCVACNVLTGLFTLAFMKESRWNNDVGESSSPGICSGMWHRLCGLFEGATEAIQYEELDTTEHAKEDTNQADDVKEDEDLPLEPDQGLDGNRFYVQSDESYGEVELGTVSSTMADVDNFSESDKVQAEINTHISKNEMYRKDMLITREVSLAVSSYGLLAMGYIVIDETIPLMLKLDRDEGGLSYSSSEIGTLLALGGATMLLWTLLLLPKISHHSKLWLFKKANLFAIPVALSYPVLAILNEYILDGAGDTAGREIVFALYAIIMTIKNCVATVLFLSVIITSQANTLMKIVEQ